MKNKQHRKIICLILMLLCCLAISPVKLEAAAKTNKTKIVLLKKKTYQLKINGKIKKATWKSSNKKVVSVSKKGKIKAKSAGVAKITVTVGKKKYTCNVTVPDKSLTVCKDAKETLKASGLTGTIKWKSSNKKKASISKKGKLKAKKAGKTMITAKAGKKTYRIYVTVLNKKHSYEKVSETKATCTKAGEITYRCKNCKDEYTDAQDALGHDWTKEVVEPTCEGGGYTVYTCKRNKKHTKKADFVAATGHSYGKWTVERESTCIKAGWQTATCSVCGAKDGKDVAMKAHEYENGVCKNCGSDEKDSTADEMTVSVTEDEISIRVNGVGKASDGTLTLVRMDADEYAEGDDISGISGNTEELGTEIGLYAYQKDNTYTIQRYGEQNEDRLYSKYYVISSKGVVKGPIYASEIEPERDVKKFTADTKKGLFGDDSSDMVEDTGSRYTAINFNLPNFFVAGDDAVKEKTYEWESGGKTYLFSKTYVDQIDKKVKAYTDKDIGVSLIVAAYKSSGWKDEYPVSLLYEGGCDKGSIAGVNTSTKEGVEYWTAAMEFLAERYSRSDSKYGRINNIVLGNEIDYAFSYNNISDKAESLDVYMEEYSRLLRLTHMAVSKYMDTVTVTVPTTHDWMRADYTNTYKPKEVYDWLNEKSKAEGDFNWGLSPHCYASSLAGSYGIEDDSINARKEGETDDYNTSLYLSFSNLEILEKYLEQPEMMYNGELRDVYLTESGCSSYLEEEADFGRQAAYVAAAYYKAAVLDCVDAFIYYRAVDHESEKEAMACFGLRDVNGNNKYSYDVWKYVDTQYSFRISNQYLGFAAYYDAGVLNVPGKNGNDMDATEIVKYHHTVMNGDIETYKDLMYAFTDDDDYWDKVWDESKIMTRTVESVEEWEDTVDIGDVKFYSRSFLYDGEKHELLISGKLADGVTVEYENNTLTESGEQTATAKFYKDGEQVGKRTATIKVGDVATNRSVYETGETIYVTANAESTSQWVGIYLEDDQVGDVSDGGIPSVYWYYIDGTNQISGCSYAIQDVGEYNSTRPELADLPAGNYKIVMMGKNGTYEIDDEVSITILSSKEDSELPRLDDISYEDTVKTCDGTEQSLEITGTLPENMTVEYTDNTLTEAGTTLATAHFLYYGNEIETRTAAFTLQDAYTTSLKTDKNTYTVGEDIMVTAEGEGNDWVGIYLENDTIGAVSDGGIESIYWYYVAKNGNTSGTAVNIKEKSGNSSRSDWETVKDLPAGTYKIVLLQNDGYTVLQQTTITIKEESEAKLKLDKTEYTMGDEIQVTATAESKEGAWVGLYLKEDAVDGNTYSIYWYYVNDDTHTSGNTYTISDMVDDNCKSGAQRAAYRYLPPGEYKMILTPEDGSYAVEEEVDFTITANKEIDNKMQLVDSSATYSAGSSIEITTEAYTDTGKDWVALFADGVDYTKTDATYVAWAYAAASGTTTITAPDTAGKYTLVYFGEDARHIITTRTITVE